MKFHLIRSKYLWAECSISPESLRYFVQNQFGSGKKKPTRGWFIVFWRAELEMCKLLKLLWLPGATVETGSLLRGGLWPLAKVPTLKVLPELLTLSEKLCFVIKPREIHVLILTMGMHIIELTFIFVHLYIPLLGLKTNPDQHSPVFLLASVLTSFSLFDIIRFKILHHDETWWSSKGDIAVKQCGEENVYFKNRKFCKESAVLLSVMDCYKLTRVNYEVKEILLVPPPLLLSLYPVFLANLELMG